MYRIRDGLQTIICMNLRISDFVQQDTPKI